MSDWQSGGFGLYLHWPFCQSKCPYCDFNSHVSASISQQDWQRAYLKEIDRYGAETGERVLQTVYFGGGTPSLMDPDLVASIIAKIRRTWRTSNDLEITLEANPGSVEVGRFKAYREAGVSRVSLGVQALNDGALRQLGRLHTTKEAIAALEIANSTFDRVSFDLIYARQDQTLQAWRDELSTALSLAADHLSLYQLTIEDGTAFAERAAKGGLRGLPGEDQSAEMYEATQQLCETKGFFAYEVSNHAKPGSESRHNMIYWRGGDYVGIGPGAHGRISRNGTRVATETHLLPTTWLSAALAEEGGESLRSVLTSEDQALEYLLMSLRMSEGLNLNRYKALAGRPLDPKRLERLEELDLAHTEQGQLIVTPNGRLILNAILRDLAL